MARTARVLRLTPASERRRCVWRRRTFRVLILATMGLCSCTATRPTASKSARDPFLPVASEQPPIGRSSVDLQITAEPASASQNPGQGAPHPSPRKSQPVADLPPTAAKLPVAVQAIEAEHTRVQSIEKPETAAIPETAATPETADVADTAEIPEVAEASETTENSETAEVPETAEAPQTVEVETTENSETAEVAVTAELPEAVDALQPAGQGPSTPAAAGVDEATQPAAQEPAAQKSTADPEVSDTPISEPQATRSEAAPATVTQVQYESRASWQTARRAIPEKLQAEFSTGKPVVTAAEFRAAEPRVEIQQLVHQQVADTSKPAVPELLEHEDEYLFDGGDRAHPVHYGQHARHGLDTEDTVAEYTDHTGQSHVRATNRVAIYAPRFGAVRSLSAPRLDTSVDRLASATETTRGSKLRNQVVPNSHVENQRIDGVRMRARVSGLSNEQIQFKVAQANRLTSHTKLQNAYMDLAFIGRGVFEQSDAAYLAYGVQAALNWTQDKFPMIHASDTASQSVTAQFQAQQYLGVETEKKQIGDLRIVKMADRKFADAGDVVTFTIRYDNLGERELREIRIVDNLTPRLAFIDDSASSDRPGNIVIEDNAEGSEVLRFDLDGVLRGGTGGVITFQTKVR